MGQQDMVIFTRTYDLLTWLIPATLNFPRTQRFVVTKYLYQSQLINLIIKKGNPDGPYLCYATSSFISM